MLAYTIFIPQKMVNLYKSSISATRTHNVPSKLNNQTIQNIGMQQMAALFNFLFFVSNISFLPNYRVNYYGLIVKRCSCAACYCCGSLEFALILRLELGIG